MSDLLTCRRHSRYAELLCQQIEELEVPRSLCDMKREVIVVWYLNLVQIGKNKVSAFGDGVLYIW